MLSEKLQLYKLVNYKKNHNYKFMLLGLNYSTNNYTLYSHGF